MLHAMRPMSMLGVLMALFLSVGPLGAGPGPESRLVEDAVTRLWNRPGLAMAAGLEQPPSRYRPELVRALELTTRHVKLQSVEWTPAASVAVAGRLSGRLAVRAAGQIPPSTATCQTTATIDGLVLDESQLRTRGGLRVLAPGRLQAEVSLPFDLMGVLNRGLRVSGEGGLLTVSGRRKVLLLEIPFQLEGRLEKADPIHVNLAPTQLSLARMSAPAALREALLQGINPIFCVDAALGPLAWLATVELDRLQVASSGLTIQVQGALRLPGGPAPGLPHHPLPK
jgi:hypothetical protein